MVFPGHIGGGFLVASGILYLVDPSLDASQINSLTLIGTLAGDLPDIDLIALYFSQKKSEHKDENHREYITHAPVTWLAISFLIYIAGLILNSVYTEMLAVMILAGTWTHFALDSIEYGVMWLWPISKRRFCISKNMPAEIVSTENQPRSGTFRAHWNFIKGSYLKTWTFWAEIIVTLLAIFVFLYRFSF